MPTSKGKGKGPERQVVPSESTSVTLQRAARNRVKVADLKPDVKSLVSAAQNRLRLRVALKFAWTKEATVTSTRLPNADSMIAASLREAYQRRAGDSRDGPDPMLKAAYESLQDQEGEDNTEKDLMRKSIYLVVSTASYLRGNDSAQNTTCRSGRVPLRRGMN